MRELTKEIASKEQAAIDEPILQQEIQALKKELKATKADQQECEAQKGHYEKQLAQIEPTVKSLEQVLTENPSAEQLQNMVKEATQKIEKLEAAAQYKSYRNKSNC
ncbi:hypothetical protein [Lysinibacillus pakistanensis]|uniref:hypothetical protein n=1 Tax=Lysinibacillus pakistanensis TaxID=759811 RepID=UPI003D265337